MKNRMKPPPSQRKGRDDWKEQIARIAGDILGMELENRPLRGSTGLRAHVVDQIRLSLDTSIPDESLYVTVDGQRMVSVAVAPRLVLGNAGLDWRSPSIAESVMVIAGWAIDAGLQVTRDVEADHPIDPATGRPTTWRDRIPLVVRASVAGHRYHHPEDDAVATRAAIVGDFREAIGETPTSELQAVLATIDPDAPIPSTPIAFRMLLWCEDVNWYEPENAAMAMDAVCRALDAELSA